MPENWHLRWEVLITKLFPMCQNPGIHVQIPNQAFVWSLKFRIFHIETWIQVWIKIFGKYETCKHHLLDEIYNFVIGHTHQKCCLTSIPVLQKLAWIYKTRLDLYCHCTGCFKSPCILYLFSVKVMLQKPTFLILKWFLLNARDLWHETEGVWPTFWALHEYDMNSRFPLTWIQV